jgi:hypothetical protein
MSQLQNLIKTCRATMASSSCVKYLQSKRRDLPGKYGGVTPTQCLLICLLAILSILAVTVLASVFFVIYQLRQSHTRRDGTIVP